VGVCRDDGHQVGARDVQLRQLEEGRPAAPVVLPQEPLQVLEAHCAQEPDWGSEFRRWQLGHAIRRARHIQPTCGCQSSMTRNCASAQGVHNGPCACSEKSNEGHASDAAARIHSSCDRQRRAEGLSAAQIAVQQERASRTQAVIRCDVGEGAIRHLLHAAEAAGHGQQKLLVELHGGWDGLAPLRSSSLQTCWVGHAAESLIGEGGGI